MEEHRPHFKPGSVKYTKGYRIKLLVNKIIGLIFKLASIATIVFAVVILVKQPVLTSEGLAYVSSVSGAVDKGERVMVIQNEEYHIFTPFIRYFVEQDVYYAEVVAGPYGKLKQVGDRYEVTHGAETVLVDIEDPGDGFLDKEYIIRDYNRGIDILISEKNIVGIAK